MTISYTDAAFLVFAALCALTIVMTLGLVLLWLSLRGHQNVLLAEIKAGHTREAQTLHRLVEGQAKADVAQYRVLDAAHTFNSAADTIKEVFDGLRDGRVVDEIIRAEGNDSSVTSFKRPK